MQNPVTDDQQNTGLGTDTNPAPAAPVAEEHEDTGMPMGEQAPEAPVAETPGMETPAPAMPGDAPVAPADGTEEKPEAQQPAQ